MKRGELVRRLSGLAGFEAPDARLEQVVTPSEAAAELLESAHARGDLERLEVLDLGCGTGLLAIGARLSGASRVVGVDADPRAIKVAEQNVERAKLDHVTFAVGEVGEWAGPADTVVMNPPFGAQRKHADRPFWETAYSMARRRIYAFSLRESRTFIERRAVARGARIEETHPVDWRLPATFPHHRKRSARLEVDLWVLSPGQPK